MKALPLLISSLAIFAATAASAAGTQPLGPGFDRPNKFQHQPLDGKPTPKTAKLGTSCFYYNHFMVKQVDLGEVGAEQLSILPVATAAKPLPCQRKNLPGEKLVAADDWSGYFKGVRGDYVFFDAADGVNGGLGFAVIAAGTGKKIFEDLALKELQSVTLDGATLKLRYTRVFVGSCSVPIDGEPCWKVIEGQAGLTRAQMPDCAAGYRQGKIDLAKGRCQAKPHADAKCFETELKGVEDQHFDQSSSVIDYPVETEIGSDEPTTRALGSPNTCRAAD